VSAAGSRETVPSSPSGGRASVPAPSGLSRAVAESDSVAAALRALALPDNGTSRRRFRQWVREQALDLSHFLGQAHQRGKPGPTPMRTAAEILVRHDRPRRTKTVLLRRALAETGVPDACADCGTPSTWRGRPITLEVDHVNGDWRDDRAVNLRLLCPNCHAVTATWCKGRGLHRSPGE
jgi:hypothetical protein